MPIVLQETFDVREETYSDFIYRYHRRIINLLNQFHDGIGVVGPSRLTDDTRWSTITLTNDIGRSIEIVTSLESLWLYGYRRLSDENNILPWRLVSGYTREGNFSSLPGQHESLGFNGKYTSTTPTQNVSRPALNSAITVLDKYAHTPANTDDAKDCFLLIVIYFAEALRILSIRDLLCNSFDQHDSVQVGIFNMGFARNWHTISTEFLNGSYSKEMGEYHIHNADDVKQKLWLVYNKHTKLHDLDGVRDSRPGDPGNGDETGPRDSGMGGYSGDGGPKRSGGQGGSKNEVGQPRDRVAGSRSRRPRVGRGRSGNLVHLPLSHDLVGVIQLLSTCASGSPLPAKTLLLLGIGATLKAILSGSGLVAGTTVSPALTRPPEQIFEIVNLADELLPSLPQGTISLSVSYCFLIRGISRKSRAPSSSKQDESSVTNETSAREKLLEEQPELLKQFGMDLLPILTQVYGSSINGPICHKCLSVIAKLVYYSSADMIQTLLGTTNISSLFAGILAWKDPQVLIPALQIAEILMEKLPGIFSKMVVKEGVVHAIESLICQESSSATPNQVPATDNDSDAVTGTSSRSGQYRRRASGPSMDSTNLDEVKTPPPASDSTDTPGSSSSLHVVVSGYAKSYKEKCFPGDSDSSDVRVTDDLRLLRTLCTKLNACAENSRAKGKGKLKVSAVGSFDISAGVEEQLNEVVAEMLIELSKGDGVSTFEFIGSGAVIALLNYLSCGTFGKEKIPDNTYHKLRQQAIRRYKSFISISLCFDKDGSGTPMMTLVQKLQNALSSLEQFPVMLSHSGRSSSSGGARLSSGLSALSQPFKLRLYRAQGEKLLRDYSSNVVLIDPLASLAAVEDFLWPRIQCTESSSTQKSSTNSESGSASAGPAATASSGSGPVARCSTRYTRSSVKIGGGTSGKDSQEASGSANTSSSKGKGNGKAVLKRSSEEPKGLQTINAARRKAASEKDTEMKPAHDNSSSEEDNELDASPVEIDDALMIDEDDISEDEDDDHDDELDLHDILSFDTEFGKILQVLQILVHRKKYRESSGDSTQAIDDLRFRGAPIEDLCLDFTLPGYPGYVLKEGQESTSVNIDNLEEYISLVVDAAVKMGIARQMEAFRTGLNQVFDVTSLQIFSPNELDYLICGHRDLWEAETLVDHIKFDDGYTAKSPVIVNLLEIMAEFSPEQQHAFCQFITGAPRLPLGGLAALSPKLTIVRKHPSNVTSTPTGTGATDSADEDLPSVMTYANYLKLPLYSTKEVMYKKLLYAINEGQGSFDLS